jgi:hypothetical protein
MKERKREEEKRGEKTGEDIHLSHGMPLLNFATAFAVPSPQPTIFPEEKRFDKLVTSY